VPPKKKPENFFARDTPRFAARQQRDCHPIGELKKSTAGDFERCRIEKWWMELERLHMFVATSV
jgi:hypothetical protein